MGQECGDGSIEAGRQQIRTRRPQRLPVRERAFDPHGEDTRGAGHVDVLRAVSDVGGLRRRDSEAREARLERLGVGLLVLRVLAADDGGEAPRDPETVELGLDAGPAAARHEPGAEPRCADALERSGRAGDELAPFLAIDLEPAPVGLAPLLPRETDALVRPVPVGRVRLREELVGEVDPVRREEAAVAAEARLRGVEERAVPVEEDRAETLQRFSIGTKSRSAAP